MLCWCVAWAISRVLEFVLTGGSALHVRLVVWFFGAAAAAHEFLRRVSLVGVAWRECPRLCGFVVRGFVCASLHSYYQFLSR